MAASADPEFQRLDAAAKQYKEALGLGPDPKINKIADSINKLGKENNVLISYEIRELPSHGGQAAKPIGCHCFCACACIS
jgi:hypothetical protein